MPGSAEDKSTQIGLDDVALFRFAMLPQPNDQTCGPTSLHAVYRFFNDDISLEETVNSVTSIPTGGTVSAALGTHALSRGYSATLYTYNLHVFDPTWFLPGVNLDDKLKQRRQAFRGSRKHCVTIDHYRHFLALGGRIMFQDLTAGLLRDILKRRLPILTGLCATYLYQCARERTENDHEIYDDVRGESCGHFVVLNGYDPGRRRVAIADPLANNPGFGVQHYTVSIDRLIVSIILGVVTFDANLLVIEPGLSRRTLR